MGERIGSIRALELAEELRGYRERLEIPAQVLAERLGWSPSKVSRVEHGFTAVSESDLVRYLVHCGVSADGIDAMLEMCREHGWDGYWLSTRLHTLMFYEQAAAFSAAYAPDVIPGLLQTEKYATEIIGTDRSWLVRKRMERQRLLESRPFEFYVHEQALRLPVGGARVMNEQLLKLVLVADQPGITIRVIPSALGARSVFGGECVLFRYTSHNPMVLLDHKFAGFYLDSQAHVSSYHQNMAAISEAALNRYASQELLAKLASEFDVPEDPRDVA